MTPPREPTRAGTERPGSAISEALATTALTNARTRIVGTRTGITADLVVTVVRVATAVRDALVLVARRLVAVITPLGWAMLVLAPVCLALGYRFGWVELVLGGWATLLLVGAAALYLVRRAIGRVELLVEHTRVTVGETVTGTVRAHNESRARTGGSIVEVPLGSGVARVLLPSIAGRSSVDREFAVPTARRGRIPVGPARSVRADPFGLVRREVQWSDEVALVVHPRTIGIPSVGTGQLRDLEGQSTRDLTASDIAFHALREYQSGDDRRFIHWRSTARTGQLMVRQFEETRRSRLLIALTLAQSDFASDEEFELAVSVAGSLGVRAIRDTRDLEFVASARTPEFARRKVFELSRLSTVTRTRLLDDLAQVERGLAALTVLDVARVAAATSTSIASVVLVTGSATPTTVVRAAAALFRPGTPVLAVICDPEAVPDLTRTQDLTVVRIGYLDDLRAAMERVVGR